MKYLLIQLLILFLSVILLLYFFSLSYFLPLESDVLNWYNISTVLLISFFLSESFFSLFFYLIEKFLTCSIREFPLYFRSLKWGIGLALCVVVSLMLSLLNIIPLFYAFILSAIILGILNIFKIF